MSGLSGGYLLWDLGACPITISLCVVVLVFKLMNRCVCSYLRSRVCVHVCIE